MAEELCLRFFSPHQIEHSLLECNQNPPHALSNDNLIIYLLQRASTDNDSDVSAEAMTEVYRRWGTLCQTIKGRSFLRLLIGTLIQVDDVLQSAAFEIHENDMNKTKLNAPDLAYTILTPFESALDLNLQVRVERMIVESTMRRTKTNEFFLEDAVHSATSIPFFDRVYVMSMRWLFRFLQERSTFTWAIPPMTVTNLENWFVTRNVFLQRMEWFAPFLPNLLNHSGMRRVGAVLSGSLLPLFALNHEINTETKERFMYYSDEVYRKCAISLFVCGRLMKQEVIVKTVLDSLRDAWPHSEWVVGGETTWREDDEWLARNRRGTTVYIHDQAHAFDVHLIIMPDVTLERAMVNQHLAPSRAWWDGQTLHVTASCMKSWMTRFVVERPLFGSLTSQQRRSRTVFKYAMRGFGFSMGAVMNLKLPSTLVEWLRLCTDKRTLPWYHPLYNPNMWRKAMTPERERALLECAEF